MNNQLTQLAESLDAGNIDGKPGRAADRMVDQIEAKILSGELSDGDKLPAERELINQFGLSRTVVREAIATLASKGLVEAKPRFRPTVRKPGYESAVDTVGSIVSHMISQSGGVRNLFDTRVLLEAALVREAALKAKKEDIKALRNALAANHDAINDSQQFYTTDVAFHAVLYAIPDNPVLPAVHKAYTSWLASHWKAMQRMPERNRINYESHKAIFDAILERDPDEAEAELRRHLDMAWQHVKTTFKEL